MPNKVALGRLVALVLALVTLMATAVAVSLPARADDPAAAAAPLSLTTNHLATPVDVDASSAPVLGWNVGSGTQTAYQVQVASSQDALGDDDEAWDSGKVTSAGNASVTYGGSALAASGDYYWRVRTWGAGDGPSAWSKVAQFGTGPGSTWSGATPIWTPTTSTAGGWSNYTFTGSFSILASKASVTFRAADTNDLYLWQFSTTTVAPQVAKSGTYSNLKTAEPYPAGFSVSLNTSYDFKITVIGSTFTTWLRPTGSTTWTLVDTTTDSTYPTGGIGVRTGSSENYTLDNLLVEDTDGNTLYSNDFSTSNGDFACATTANGVLTVPKSQNCVKNPAGVVAVSTSWAFMRGSVDIADKPVAWAHLYATGASTTGARQFVYKMSLNGTFVGTGPTRSIGSETRYDGFDVTDDLKQGNTNVIGALAYTTSTKKFLADLVVRYTDGTTQTFGTGSDWRAIDGSHALPASSSIGTSYYVAPQENTDASSYPFGFDKAGFDDSTWASAATQPAFVNLVPTPTAKVGQKTEKPVKVTEYSPGDYFIDYGRTWIGGMSLNLDGTAGQKVDIRYGQTTSAANTVRYKTSAGNTYEDVWTLKDGQQHLETWGPRVFRYVQVIGAPTGLTADDLTAEAYLYPFDETQAQFDSSDSNLNQVWQFTKNTVETANQDLYVDSWERERGVYEADGYMQQLENLYTGGDSALGTYSFQYLLANRTWPTEWPIYDVLAAYDNYMATGDSSTLSTEYAALQGKLPTKWIDPTTGLIHKTTGLNGCTSTDCDIVDWPAGDRDGYVFTSYNTVINAISYRSFADMASIATALGKTADAASYQATADTLKKAVNNRMWDASTGAYRDGLNDDLSAVNHDAIQATAFAVAFGLASDSQAQTATKYLASRGMACSVYCAGFLLDAVYAGNDGDLGQALLTGTGTNSWIHEIGLGAGAAMEAWDPAEKSNLTYSHPWGASPAYNIPQDMFGIQPTTAGYATFQVKPQRGSIEWAHITTPTPNGTIGVAFHADGDGTDEGIDVPANSTATAYVPTSDSDARSVYVDGVPTDATNSDGFLKVDDLAPGCHVLTSQAGSAPYSDGKLTAACAGGYTAPSVAVGQPTIVGSAVVGQTLTVTPGDVTPASATSTYAWKDGDTTVSTESSYTVKPSDVGHTLSVVQTATFGELTGLATSVPTATVTAASFTQGPTATVSGVLQVGQPLTADEGSPAPTPASYDYQWYADDDAIDGATSKTFDLTSAQKGARISVKVTAVLDGYADASDTSPATAKVASDKAPTLTLSSSKVTLRLKQSTTLTWTSSDADTVAASGSWSGTKDASGSESVTPTAVGTAVYVLKATDSAGSTTAQVSVPVGLPAKVLHVVTPTTGIVGHKLSVRVAGMGVHEPYTIYVAGIKVRAGRVDGAGHLAVTVTVPKVATGKHTVRVTGAYSDRTGTRTVKIYRLTALSVSLIKKVHAGDQQKVTVKHLVPGEKVKVTYAGKRVSKTSAKANAKGEYTVTFKVGALWGTFKVKATGKLNGRSTTKTFSVVNRCPGGTYYCR